MTELKLVKAQLIFKYNSYDKIEIRSKEGRIAGKIRRYIAWPFICLGLAILFGGDGYETVFNGREET